MKNKLCLLIVAVICLGAPANNSRGENSVHSDLAWSIVPSPHQAGVKLYGVSLLSATEGWAVGDIYSPLTPIIYHWNGTSWTVSPGALPDTSLRDVAATSANDAWAVGYQEDDTAGDLTVTLHWDGVSWTRISSPNPSDGSYLNGVAAVAPDDIWAVGQQESDTTIYGALILHWDGNSWMVSPTRGGGYRALADVSALATNDVWAIGTKFSFTNGYQGLAMHWNGTRWSEIPMPLSESGYTFLRALTAISPTDIWAVGVAGANPVKPVTVHWDGIAWTYITNPLLNTDYAFLNSITALASNDVWAAGYITDRNGTDRTLVEHWDGNAWTRIAVPEMRQAYNELWAIAPDQAGGLWTVGSFQPTDFSRPLNSLVLHGSP